MEHVPSCRSGGRFPDADEPVALARERLSPPAAPALAPPHARELCHQVELRRPHVAERDRPWPERPITLGVVVRDQALVGDVVLVEAEPRRALEVEGMDRLAG